MIALEKHAVMIDLREEMSWESEYKVRNMFQTGISNRNLVKTIISLKNKFKYASMLYDKYDEAIIDERLEY